MGALLHFKHGEGKRIRLHYCVTDLISTGKLSLSLKPLRSRQMEESESSVVTALLYLSLQFTMMR